MHIGSGLGAGDPPAGAVGGGDAPVDGGGHLQDDQWPTGPSMVEVRGQLFSHFVGSYPDHHLQPHLSKSCDAPTGDLRIRILDGHHDTGHPSGHDGLSARTGPSLVMTRLQRGH